MAGANNKSGEPTIIKKYANRRLYDTGRSSYVTLEDLRIMVKEGHDFVVYDAKSGDDITRQILTQIIVDQESKGESLLPETFLRQLIGYYGEEMNNLLPNYLEQTLEMFSQNQERFSEMFPMSTFEEVSRKNMNMFENAMRSWTNFASSNSGDDKNNS
jgi:polyhydroxyalkanoate synthesis repressor PhaR